MRLVSLRTILGIGMVSLALVPALLVAGLMMHASARSVEDLAGSLLSGVAQRVQLGTEDHLRRAHDVLNGLLSVRLTPAETAQAREWLRNPESFEAMAFALTRQSPDVPSVYFGNVLGAYLGVETTPEGVRVALRRADGVGRNFYRARQPGDRSQLLATEHASFEPRLRAWYGVAVVAKGRVFSPVRVSPERRELVVSLSQPVYDAEGGVAGVFGADLYLKQLADALRTQRISSHGAAFVVDERGALVASSAGDALYREVGGQLERRSPRDSGNEVIRAGFSALEALWAQRREDVVGSDTSLKRLDLPGGTLLMVQRPFGEALGLRWTLVVAVPESDFTAGIDRARRVSLGVIAALVLLGALVAWLIARSIGRRLTRLSLAAGQLGRGEVPTIDRATRIREVRQLSEVLHESAEKLRAYREQTRADAVKLQQANDTLESRVVERTAELAQSREAALSAARAKTAFLATMSHEIRTPLNGVVGMGTLLAETSLDAEQSDYLQTIRLSSDQLLAMVNDILDFSKIESGKLELEAEPLNLRNAVEEACDIAAPRAREKGLELIIDVPEPQDGGFPSAIVGDVTRLRQVLINLVSNAVKFTAQGEVTVQSRMLPGAGVDGIAMLEFRVRDSGIGIPAERLDSLFEAFSQVDASTTRRFGGTGLGLAICLRLVKLMGGEIGVESRLGHGSTFWFTLPATVSGAGPAQDVSGDGLLKGCRALIVDDHPTNLCILRRQLESWGMVVASAQSGLNALQWLERAEASGAGQAGGSGAMPDVIITDMHMPDMDGLTLVRHLDASPRWRGIARVLLSSGFMPSGDESALLFRARLLKPVRQAQLRATLTHCISSHPALSGPGPAPAPAPGAGPRKHGTVLVADDNPINLKVAGAMLRKLGYAVQTAVNGREAVAAVERSVAQGQPFGAILMDVNMPDTDGMEATRLILRAWGVSAPPVIALTAAALPQDQARCLAAGMVDYLSKPLHVSALALALDKWVSGSQSPEGGHGAGGPAMATASPAADDGSAMLMDFSRLEEFREFDDAQQTLTREVVGMFLNDAPRRLRAIDAAIKAGDAGALAVASHALKGAASNIGAIALQTMCGRLEEDSRERVPRDAAIRQAQLQRLWAQTRWALAAWA